MRNVTNKEIAVKIDTLIEEFRQHRQDFREHIKADALIQNEVIKLTTIEEGRRWQIRTLWGTALTALFATIARMLWPSS